MRKISILLIFLCSVDLLLAQETGIKFMKGNEWNTAIKLAKQQNKLIFVDFYTSWCGPCKLMAKNVFPKQEVGDYMNKTFINVKMLCDSKDSVEKYQAAKLMKKFKVSAFPSMFWINADEEIEDTHVGLIGAKEFLEFAQSASNLSSNFAGIVKKWNNGDHSKNTALRYFSFTRNRNNDFDSYYMSLPDKDKLDTTFVNSLLKCKMELSSDSKVFHYWAKDCNNKFSKKLKQSIKLVILATLDNFYENNSDDNKAEIVRHYYDDCPIRYGKILYDYHNLGILMMDTLHKKEVGDTFVKMCQNYEKECLFFVPLVVTTLYVMMPKEGYSNSSMKYVPKWLKMSEKDLEKPLGNSSPAYYAYAYAVALDAKRATAYAKKALEIASSPTLTGLEKEYMQYAIPSFNDIIKRFK